MHPAPSIILFTVLSGTGFGLMIFLGLSDQLINPVFVVITALLAYSLSVGGLLSSLFHLGHPERFWRALTQWRSSWLSREGILAIATLTVFTLHIGCIIMFGAHIIVIGWISSLLALATIFSTSMIYVQMRTIPAWNTRLTCLLFMSYALSSASMLFYGIELIFISAGKSYPWFVMFWLLVSCIIQAYWWYHNHNLAFASTAETATQLTKTGKVRLFEAPHSSPNYLMKEMVYKIGRKHAKTLRLIAVIIGGVLPAILIAIPAESSIQPYLLLTAFAGHLSGIFVTRWLFFAEAKHVVSLYYEQ